jgi:hypothetical protein
MTKTVLIIGDEFDLSTNNVIDWLYSFGVESIRINQKNKILDIILSLNNKGYSLELITNNNKIDIKNISVFWFRRGILFNNFNEIKELPEKFIKGISDINLIDVVKSCEFEEIWHIQKDDIDVCRDCEFRYICIDCRAFIKDKTNIYSQPEKCSYNPYIAKWEGEEGWLSIEQWRKENPNW